MPASSLPRARHDVRSPADVPADARVAVTDDVQADAPVDDAAREAALVGWLHATGPVLVGYSGGVDSAYLAAVAVATLGADRVLAVIGRSASYPAEQWRTARAHADAIGLVVEELDTRELDDPRYAANPTNRCYWCKAELWGRLAPLAEARGMTLLDGTNADDLRDHRPGARAAAEQGVRSPLATLGFTKAAIRRLSAARGLATADRQSAPCLASRLPYGSPVTRARLAEVEAAESALRALGVVGDLRVRHHGPLARVELAADVLAHWLVPERAARLAAAVRAAGFARVALDLRGFRSGSLNVLSGVHAA